MAFLERLDGCAPGGPGRTERVLEAYPAQDSRDLVVAPVVIVSELPGEIRQRLIGLDDKILESLNEPDIAAIDVVARFLDGESERIVRSPVRRPAHLDVAEEHHARRSPVVDHVREYIDVHEQAVRLSCEQLTPLAVGVPQPDGRLAGIRADAEHVELEFEVDGWGGITGRERPLHPEAALLHAETRLPVGTEFTLWGCDPRGTERVLPVGIDALGVLDPVRHREAVDLEVFRRLLGTHGVRCTRSDD